MAGPSHQAGRGGLAPDDTLPFVTLPYLVFLDSSAYFLFDPRRRTPGPRSANLPTGDRRASQPGAGLLARTAVHRHGANCYNKMLGETWIDGTALGIVFRLADFAPSLFAGFRTGSRSGGVVAAVLAVLLHGGTILFMGLVASGLRIIVYQTVLLSDDQYLRLAGISVGAYPEEPAAGPLHTGRRSGLTANRGHHAGYRHFAWRLPSRNVHL